MYCFGNAVQPVKGIVLTFSEVTKQMSVHSRPEFNFTSFFFPDKPTSLLGLFAKERGYL